MHAAHLLLFGAPAVVESARTALAAEYAHAQITLARTRPGKEADEEVQAECRHASHLVYVQGAGQCFIMIFWRYYCIRYSPSLITVYY